MTGTFTYQFDTPVYKGSTRIRTGLFINGLWVKAMDPKAMIDVRNPSTGEVITSVAAGATGDVHAAVLAALEAYKTTWGLSVPGSQRGLLLSKLADLVEKHADELAAIESLNTGKSFAVARGFDITNTITTLRYYAGWADKVHGKTIETNEKKLAYTRHEPYGVVGSIIPWNFPLTSIGMKIAPALATGNTVVLKPSEMTPLTALRLCDLIVEAGFPPGVVNIVNGYGHTVGDAIVRHPQVGKISFTGSTLVGRKIMHGAGDSNLKSVTLELGGKSPTIIFDDADLEQAVKWAAIGIFMNAGQVCVAGSRIFVQEGIYENFIKKFTESALGLGKATGDPFELGSQHGPLISQTQFDRVMGYIESGKAAGATVHSGGGRTGKAGYFVQPTIFTDVLPDMKIIREEIFGPVGAVMKFTSEREAIQMANDTVYGLSANVFTKNVDRAIRVAHHIETGSVFINSASTLEASVPFGGYKQSGFGRELGEYALDTYTRVKAVHVNLGHEL